MDIKNIRNDFPMLSKKLKMQDNALVYLDNAATTFKPQCVSDAINEYNTKLTSNSHRGDYDLCYQIDKKIDEARKDVANFINSKEKEVVFTSGTSMSINMIAYGYAMKYLSSSDEILITQAEHASNVLPWFKVKEIKGCEVNFIPLNNEGRLTPDNLRKVISKKTKIVSLAYVSNVLGYKNDIKELAKIAHEFGAILVCDGAQSVPHFKTDVKELDCDFLAFSAHKMCGPTGIGVLYGKYELLEKMDSVFTGGGMNVSFDMSCNVNILPPPEKFEAGTLNIEGIIGFDAAIKYINSIGIENIEKREIELRKYAIDELSKLDNIIIYNKNAESGIITFNIKDVFAQDLGSYFNSRGVAIRTGLHCAKILPTFLNTLATARMSLYFYNTKEEIDKFIAFFLI